jgi:hypothetical protein
MLTATEPQAAERAADDDADDLCHLVCEEHGPDRAFCGRDVSRDPWVPWWWAALDCVVCVDIDDTCEREGVCCEAEAD